jgi:hypothetical protein
MGFWRFIFSFLYIRNWHSGQMELSRPRIALFASAIFLLILAITLITFLQTPIEYNAR